MNAEGWQQLKSVFQAAIELAPEDSEAFLAQACDGNGELRLQVDRLLKSHHNAGEFLVSPDVIEAGAVLVDGKRSEADKEERVGQRIGPYEIIRELGQWWHGHRVSGCSRRRSVSKTGGH